MNFFFKFKISILERLQIYLKIKVIENSNRCHIKFENFLHIGRNVRQESIGTPVRTCMSHDNCPDG